MSEILEFFLHVENHLRDFIANHGLWVYGLLFLIIFCETGLVVTPFLPGDSLLFACGALCAQTAPGSSDTLMSLALLLPLLLVAAILGDAVNYLIGKAFGPWLVGRKWFRRDYLTRTEKFFTKHGSKAVIMARFVPIVRTFAPFAAGLGAMEGKRFFAANIIGAILWVSSFMLAGYCFGEMEVVKRNMKIFIVGIVIVSVLPIVWEWWKARRESSRAASNT
jgi:membrane-associated protein